MATVNSGFFIALEGGEGAGKSTIIQYISQYLSDKNYNYLCTREPGGSKLGEKIRTILLNQEQDESLCPLSELLLMYASRAQLVETIIKPALNEGKIVISDRFFLSSFAYQGGGRGFNLEKIKLLNDFTLDNFKPNLTLLLDIDVNLGFERVNKRGSKDRFESEHLSFFTRVRESYLQYAKAHPQEVIIIDASLDLVQVKAQVKQALDLYFKG